MNSRNHRSMVLTGSVALLLGLVLPPATANGEACPKGNFPASGQTAPYQADKNDGIPGPVDVPDDGTLEAGASLRYKDKGNGTIIDLNTGLIWEKKSDDGFLHDKDNTYRWSGDGTQETIWDWLDDINTEGGTGFAGFSDWCIPNVKELQTIINYGDGTQPAVSPVFDTNCGGSTVLTGSCTASSFYWSSSTSAFGPSLAWVVFFYSGNVNASSKNVDFYVRAVRADCL